MYMDKLRGVLQEEDYVRVSQKFNFERTNLNEQKKELEEKLIGLDNKIESKNHTKEEKELDKLIEEFLNGYEKSYKWTIQNPTAAGKLCEKFDFGLNANIVEKSIPNANYTFIKAQDSKEQINEFLQILMKLDTRTVGDKLPEDDFYYAP